MSKPLKPDQVAAAMRFYEITFASIGKQPATTDVEQASEHGALPPAPSNPPPHEGPPMTGTPPRLPSMFEQFMSAAASAAAAKSEAQRPPWPPNPFPTGIRSGSVTDRVLAELRRAYPQTLEHGQLRHRCQAGRGAVNWATSFLIHLGKVQSFADPRSPQYRRYRLAPGEADDAR